MASLSLGLTDWIVSIIGMYGYPGLFAIMVIEGVFTPIPSEIVVPFAGYLAAQGTMNLLLVILVATAGATTGSTIAYYIGYYAGRPLLLRYGRFIRLGEEDLRWAEAWFEKYGDWGNLLGHAVPGVRSFISFPAGMAKMKLWRYVVSTAVGSAIWNTVLAVAGFLVIDQWRSFAQTTENVDLYVVVSAILLLFGYIYLRRARLRRAEGRASG